MASRLLRALPAPILVVNGSEDAIAGPMAPVAGLLPQARTVVVPQVDHMRALSQPAFQAVVLGFLQETVRRR